ncbi:hypothetical protein DPEC_G00002110 [Dallia pectoralis]|uniref:Uncharacterized protein n=1 Tax=Dallia pectoralis TaxID=75939 RepID=A0ACC2HIW3_DALPE|nr:hypothetical protein DPEC_G00002110 [Dallia pectoralis]
MGEGGGQRLANQESHRPMQPFSTGQGIGGDSGQHGQSPGQPGEHASRRNLQVDFSSSGRRSVRSSSVSPDRGVTPTSPYSVPQIAPMPVSKLCPLCSTTELTNSPAMPNYNTCTQCRSTVCNQCGFNPNPHLTETETIPAEHYVRGVPPGRLSVSVCLAPWLISLCFDSSHWQENDSSGHFSVLPLDVQAGWRHRAGEFQKGTEKGRAGFFSAPTMRKKSGKRHRGTKPTPGTRLREYWSTCHRASL